jgi:RHS repeat-associated protein
MTSGNNTSYYIRDGLGSSANLTSSSGSTQWTWSYEPFGSVRTETKASGNQPENFMKFTGEYLDPTGFYHLRARHYDPAVGRFLRPDPVDSGVGAALVSAYAYSECRPTVLSDPSGMVARPMSPTDAAEEAAALAGSRTQYRSIGLKRIKKVGPIPCQLAMLATLEDDRLTSTERQLVFTANFIDQHKSLTRVRGVVTLGVRDTKREEAHSFIAVAGIKGGQRQANGGIAYFLPPRYQNIVSLGYRGPIRTRAERIDLYDDRTDVRVLLTTFFARFNREYWCSYKESKE